MSGNTDRFVMFDAPIPRNCSKHLFLATVTFVADHTNATDAAAWLCNNSCKPTHSLNPPWTNSACLACDCIQTHLQPKPASPTWAAGATCPSLDLEFAVQPPPTNLHSMD